MKRIIKLAIMPLFFLLLIQPAQGQKLLKRLKEKAQERIEQKAEQRVEKKMDEKIDEGLDKVEDSLEKNNKDGNSDSAGTSANSSNAKSQQRMSGLLKGMGLSGEPVPHADSYSFSDLIQMHVESFDKNGKKTSAGEFITHLSPKSKSMAYEMISGDMAEPGQGMFIIDTKNGAMIILSDKDGDKTGIIYGIGSFFQSKGENYDDVESKLSESPESYLSNPNVTKTGRTKTIAGYKCEEYKYNDEDTESDIWITKDLKIDTHDYFSTLFKSNLYSQGIGWGYMMAATTLDKTTGDKTTMEVTKVDTHSNVTYSLNDYQITNLGSFKMPATQEEEKK